MVVRWSVRFHWHSPLATSQTSGSTFEINWTHQIPEFQSIKTRRRRNQMRLWRYKNRLLCWACSKLQIQYRHQHWPCFDRLGSWTLAVCCEKIHWIVGRKSSVENNITLIVIGFLPIFVVLNPHYCIFVITTDFDSLLIVANGKSQQSVRMIYVRTEIINCLLKYMNDFDTSKYLSQQSVGVFDKRKKYFASTGCALDLDIFDKMWTQGQTVTFDRSVAGANAATNRFRCFDDPIQLNVSSMYIRWPGLLQKLCIFTLHRWKLQEQKLTLNAKIYQTPGKKKTK